MEDRIRLSRPRCALLEQFALTLVAGLALSASSAGQEVPAHRNWPGPGQLFVGSCYQPIDRSSMLGTPILRPTNWSSCRPIT
jgi:beta-galactosidase